MSPAIRLGGERPPIDRPPPERRARIRSASVQVGPIETRSIRVEGDGRPALLLHGWMDNADTWLSVLERLSVEGRPAVAYDLPGFGAAPHLEDGADVLDGLVDFAADAVTDVAEQSGEDVLVVGNSLGGWVALKLAQRAELPLAGVVAIGPAGFRMAPFFFTADRIPAVYRVLSLPSPLPDAFVRGIVARFYRTLAFADPNGVEQVVVDRFTAPNAKRADLRRRIEYAKRLRPHLKAPLEPAPIEVPVTVLWGDADRLCMPEGAERLARMLPAARIEMLAGVGHTPQVECPDVVVEAIAELAVR